MMSLLNEFPYKLISLNTVDELDRVLTDYGPPLIPCVLYIVNTLSLSIIYNLLKALYSKAIVHNVFTQIFLYHPSNFCLKDQGMSFGDHENYLHEIGQYNVVAIGGTFDHLHSGHAFLLSIACLIAKEKVIIGITDESMITHKENSDLIQTKEVREGSVLRFVDNFYNFNKKEIVMSTLQDPYGPTIEDPTIEAIVVSPESRIGAIKINEIRIKRNMKPMKLVDVEHLKLSDGTILSSSYIRRKLKSSQMQMLNKL